MKSTKMQAVRLPMESVVHQLIEKKGTGQTDTSPSNEK
ncbi:hypothetical protein KR50_00370 [Jeotgalibacillus campisalis]|uniref:Uncharacterized protein n=1 Tax=Jeotgalibacillus campisalis TaxID=220754 RepID=A0A0C2W9J1_9BACL|nr:hypothetical protein KR50_00370 [Jeotgalibacillus campisalis]